MHKNINNYLDASIGWLADTEPVQNNEQPTCTWICGCPCTQYKCQHKSTRG